MASRAATNADRVAPGIAIGTAGRAGMEIVLAVVRVAIGPLEIEETGLLRLQDMDLASRRHRYKRLPPNRAPRVQVVRSCRR